MNEDRSELVEALLAAYALDEVTNAERREVEAYLMNNPDAQQQVDALRDAVAALPFDVTPMMPSEQVEAKLMARVEADAQRRFPEQYVKPLSLWERLRQFFSTPAVGGLGMAFAALALVWGFVLIQQTADLRQQLTATEADRGVLMQTNGRLSDEVATLTVERDELEGETSSLAANNEQLAGRVGVLEAANASLSSELNRIAAENENLTTTIANLTGENGELSLQNVSLTEQVETQEAVLGLIESPTVQSVTLNGESGAEGLIIVDPAKNIALLVVDGMFELAEDQVYQVLLIRETGHETADTFRVDTAGQGVLLVQSDVPLSDFTQIGVSIEPAGGSEQRTGDVVIIGEL